MKHDGRARGSSVAGTIVLPHATAFWVGVVVSTVVAVLAAPIGLFGDPRPTARGDHRRATARRRGLNGAVRWAYP